VAPGALNVTHDKRPASGSLLIIDPGTRHPELGCVEWLSREARALGLTPTLCLPALPALTASVKEELGAHIEGDALTLAELTLIDPRDLRGVIILGSGASPAHPLDWQDELGGWLAGLLANPTREATPLLGICYGHQLIASRMGSTVTQLWGGEKASGLRRARLCEPRLGLEGPVSLIVSHRDGVLSVPEGWVSLVSDSPSEELLSRVTGVEEADPVVAIEAMAHAVAPWWGFQAHIEAERSFITQNSVEASLPSPYDGHRVTRAFLKRCSEREIRA